MHGNECSAEFLLQCSWQLLVAFWRLLQFASKAKMPIRICLVKLLCCVAQLSAPHRKASAKSHNPCGSTRDISLPTKACARNGQDSPAAILKSLCPAASPQAGGPKQSTPPFRQAFLPLNGCSYPCVKYLHTARKTKHLSSPMSRQQLLHAL